MRKLNFLFAVMIALMGVFTSCSNDEDAAPPTVKLTVIDATKAYAAGALVPVSVEVSSTVNLTSLEFKFGKGTVGANSAVTKCTPEGFEPINPKGVKVSFKAKATGSFVVEYSIQLPADAAAGDLEVTVTATDQNVKTTVATAKIKVASSYATVTKTLKSGGAGNKTNEAFMAIDGGLSYNVVDAQTNAAKVDFAFMRNTQLKALDAYTLCSPNYSKLADVYNFGAAGTLNAATMKATVLKKVTLTSLDDDAAVKAAVDGLTTGTVAFVKDLKDGDFVAFKSEKFAGVIKVVKCTDGSSYTGSTMEVTVKYAAVVAK